MFDARKVIFSILIQNAPEYQIRAEISILTRDFVLFAPRDHIPLMEFAIPIQNRTLWRIIAPFGMINSVFSAKKGIISVKLQDHVNLSAKTFSAETGMMTEIVQFVIEDFYWNKISVLKLKTYLRVLKIKFWTKITSANLFLKIVKLGIHSMENASNALKDSIGKIGNVSVHPKDIAKTPDA